MIDTNALRTRNQALDILVVDDDDDSLKAIEYCLFPLGHRCTKEKDPENALALYRKNGYDIVFTDMQMPHMTGIDLLKAIRSFDEKARIVIVTAYGDLDTARAAVNNRAYGFLGKPIVIEEIYGLVHLIEREIRREESEKIDKEKIEREYLRLKVVYMELLEQLRTIDGGNGHSE